MTVAEIQEEKESRKVFRRVYSESPEGQQVLTWILNECGYFSMDPQQTDPLMIAFCNRLLYKIGIIHASNLTEDTRARAEQANDRDLRTLEESIEKREDV